MKLNVCRVIFLLAFNSYNGLRSTVKNENVFFWAGALV